MVFDTTALKLERQQKIKGGFKSKITEIPLASITSVEFEFNGETTEMQIKRSSKAYTATMTPIDAAKVKAALIKNGLPSKLITDIQD